MASHWISYLVILLALVSVIIRNRRGRPLKMERLWILPVAMAGGAAFFLRAEGIPSPITVLALAVALLIGGAAGWQRGRLTRIVLNPANHSFTSHASPAGLILLGVLFALRAGLRVYVERTAHSAAITTMAADALIVFAVGMIAVQRVEMALRCRRMLAEARAQTPAPATITDDAPVRGD